jgi:2-amino-4-hydroxy-6-hydroxymethyldihydropteridine diphosphokinase
MPRVGIALGSNLGNRLENLRNACDRLRAIVVPGTSFLQAPVYQTAPVFCPDGSPDFYNSVVEIEFAGTPFELLEITQSIQAQLGRIDSTERNAPRTIDLDLLYFGEETVESAHLHLPHPRLHERRFVLQPLADIRPDLILIGQSFPVAQLLENLDSSEPALSVVR